MRTKARIAIIGAGPAGIAAALQLTRTGFKPLIFEQNKVGGLLGNAHWIENYPGFARGISGDDLVQNMREHLARWKIPVRMQRVRGITKKNKKYSIRARRNYKADVLVIASGTAPRKPSFDTGSFGCQVLFEIAPIRKSRGKRIIIIGAGDAAYDYALNLSKRNKVMIVKRTLRSRALALLERRVRSTGNITVMHNSQVTTIGKKQHELQVVIATQDRRLSVACDYLVYAIGRIPAFDFLSPGLKKKFPEGDPTLYFIGDVKNRDTRQVAIAVGDGVKAAMEIAGRSLKNGRL
ncbi:NAD(P)/FAD-dependent oxidoreductase [candidate division WOR-3 bacterium]|nr:NAD(P)/FAD-dependent oxidoreductase [candidate division WOR-3 bacterium]